MSDETLIELLEEAGARIPIEPAPSTAALREVLERRRRRTWTVLGAAAVTLAVVGGVVSLIVAGGGGSSPSPAPPGPTGPVQRFGVGAVIAEVPMTWGVNDYGNCNQPARNTVMIDTSRFMSACLGAYPDEVSELSVGALKLPPGTETERVTVDGHRAERTRTECAASMDPDVEVCRATIYFPEYDGAVFVATSSVGSQQVEKMLTWIHVSDEYRAVPEYERMLSNLPNGSGEDYVRELEEAGVRAEVVQQAWRPGVAEGDLVGVQPQPGTAVRTGDPVRVTVGGAPRGPAADMLMSLTYDDAYAGHPGRGRVLYDRSLRGTQLRLEVALGGELRYEFAGPDAGRVSVSFVRSSTQTGPEALERIPTSSYSWEWRAVRTGTSTLTVSAEDEAGIPRVLGTVEIRVERRAR